MSDRLMRGCIAIFLVPAFLGPLTVSAQSVTQPIAVPALVSSTADPGPSEGHGNCRVVIRVNDTLQFKPDRIEVPNQCEQFTVILRHEGRLPKVASPRNWVLTEQRHADAVARDAAQTSVLTDWVNPNDPRVLAHSSVIGRDQSVRVDVPIGLLKPGVSYVYLSTIPGFSPLLRGTLTLLQ